jgi:DHA2 family multidrug resistance protein
MLDRGELKGWFSSTEIVVEATLAGLGLYLFVVHMLTADRPFLDPRMFQDLNFVTGIGLIFVMGLILLATTALMPPFLQDLLGYPVLTAGFVLGPRGIGTTFAMLAVGRLAGRMDNRLLILFGLGMTAFSLWQMTEFTVDVSMATIVWIGVIQGFGMGFLWIPLSMIAFATLPPQRRTEAAGMFNLMRNIGSSVGIATMVALLSQNKQINHAALAEHVTPFNPALREAAAPPAWSLDSVGTLMALNEAIVREATSIAYLNDFRLLLYITLAAMPLLLLVRHPGR